MNILWTMPIHPIGQKFRKGDYGSPYSIKDYYAVDANYGTVSDYQQLVSEALQTWNESHHGSRRALHHVGQHYVMEHPEFCKHDAQGKIMSPVPEWTDVAALNYGSPALRQYMVEMLKYWIRTCDVDGFRCDAAPP